MSGAFQAQKILEINPGWAPDALDALRAVTMLAGAMSVPKWDAMLAVVEGADYPRCDVTWHDEVQGLIVHCFQSPDSWGAFLTSSLAFSAPSVRVELGGQAIENWPRELFVPSLMAWQALRHFFTTGAQDPEQLWVSTGDIPRETLWMALSDRPVNWRRPTS